MRPEQQEWGFFTKNTMARDQQEGRLIHSFLRYCKQKGQSALPMEMLDLTDRIKTNSKDASFRILKRRLNNLTAVLVFMN